MAARAYRSGRIGLALVSIPVQIFSATKSAGAIGFHQVHEPSGKTGGKTRKPAGKSSSKARKSSAKVGETGNSGPKKAKTTRASGCRSSAVDGLRAGVFSCPWLLENLA